MNMKMCIFDSHDDNLYTSQLLISAMRVKKIKSEHEFTSNSPLF